MSMTVWEWFEQRSYHHRDFASLGVSGGNGAQHMEASAMLAVKFGLLGSIGSDFHNPQQIWNPLGRSLKLPDCVVPVWRERIST